MKVNLTSDDPHRNIGEVTIIDMKDFEIKENIQELVEICYKASFDAGWHTDLATGQLKDRNRAEMLMLMVSEISEAMEGERKNLMDTHLPDRPMAEVELADAIIRICDYAGRWGYDLGGAVIEKLAYNAQRADHKIENRIKEGGKKF
jgi:hypothetical protein